MKTPTQTRPREPRSKPTVYTAALKDARAKLKAAEIELQQVDKRRQYLAVEIPRLKHVIAALEGTSTPPAPLPVYPPPPPPNTGHLPMVEAYTPREVPDGAGVILSTPEVIAGATTPEELPGMSEEGWA